MTSTPFPPARCSAGANTRLDAPGRLPAESSTYREGRRVWQNLPCSVGYPVSVSFWKHVRNYSGNKCRSVDIYILPGAAESGWPFPVAQMFLPEKKHSLPEWIGQNKLRLYREKNGPAPQSDESAGISGSEWNVTSLWIGAGSRACCRFSAPRNFSEDFGKMATLKGKNVRKLLERRKRGKPSHGEAKSHRKSRTAASPKPNIAPHWRAKSSLGMREIVMSTSQIQALPCKKKRKAVSLFRNPPSCAFLGGDPLNCGSPFWRPLKTKKTETEGHLRTHPPTSAQPPRAMRLRVLHEEFWRRQPKQETRKVTRHVQEAIRSLVTC